MIKLKKSLIVICLIFTICLGIPCYALVTPVSGNKSTGTSPYVPSVPPEHSTEELYQDIFMTLLLPYIQRSVDDYYKDYLTISPIIAPYDVKILKADRVGEYRTFDFLLKIELHPYVGPHLDVGLDYITIRVNPVNNVKIEKYEHVKSYNLPDNYQNIIKKELP